MSAPASGQGLTNEQLMLRQAQQQSQVAAQQQAAAVARAQEQAVAGQVRNCSRGLERTLVLVPGT